MTKAYAQLKYSIECCLFLQAIIIAAVVVKKKYKRVLESYERSSYVLLVSLFDLCSVNITHAETEFATRIFYAHGILTELFNFKLFSLQIVIYGYFHR
jgi:hypothetical protein